MICKTQILWGYTVVGCVCHGFSELIASILKLNSDMISLITVIFFVLFILNFKIEPMEESDNLFDFKIENRRT